MSLNIVIIGSGNLAEHLSKAFQLTGHKIVQVYSRNIGHARLLADKAGAKAIDNFKLINQSADLYVIAISDGAIEQILTKLNFSNEQVVHTAGSVPLSVFNPEFNNCGVFYPLQTFSKSRNIDFSEVPICIEANNSIFESFLIDLANQISDSVWKIDSVQRKQLHLAAVFANNFVNHLYSIAKEVISKENIDFRILFPLIKETASKVLELDPKLAQTGPALRNDTESLKKHLELLSSTPEYQTIYKLISNDIYLKNSKL